MIKLSENDRKLDKSIKKITIFGFFVIWFIFSSMVFLFLVSAPVLKEKKIITIPEGYSLIETSKLLKEKNIIKSGFLLRVFMQFRGDLVKSGTYNFSEPQDMFNIMQRIENSSYGDVYVILKILEGSSNKQLIRTVKKSKLIVDEKILTQLIKNKEGYLFPDTYQFFPDANEEIIVKKLEDTFTEKIEMAILDKKIDRSISDIVIMASIIEKEASNNLEEKRVISGILWKRINEGIPMQVDAPFLYERGKGSFQLSIQDLRKDSPYNTYTNKGLTPAPIGNPGYDSLYAAAHPIDSPYYFYLHSTGGKIYFGKNYNEHLKNKKLYIR